MATEKGIRIRLSFLYADVVGQLVDVIRRAWEELGEMLPGFFDGVDDAFGEHAVLEADRQLRRDLVPETGGHFLVDPFVAEDDELLFFGCDEEKHAVAEHRLGHAEPFESALGDGAEIAAS